MSSRSTTGGHRWLLLPAVLTLLVPLASPASAQASDTSLPAVVRGDTWFLRDSLSPGPATTTFSFGDPSDLPLFGDWDGDGSETPGTFRGGVFVLSNTYDEADAFSVGLGRPHDTPIAGDWDGDGDDDIGVVRGNVWYLDLDLSGGVAERSFGYGRATDTPMVGDWDGDGVDTAGVMRGNDWYLENEHDSDGRAGISFSYGRDTDRPIVGRWQAGATHDQIGVTRGKIWYLQYELESGVADRSFAYGAYYDRKLTWGDAATTGQSAPDAPQRIYYYWVGTEGNPNGDVDTIARIANLALADGRGWSVDYELLFVETGDVDAADFEIYLTDDDDVGDKAPGCSDQYSCTVGNRIYINDDNWNHGTETFADRSLTAYRKYVINHEVGHWLGLDHYNDDDYCRESDGDRALEAPVMMQQSIRTYGCDENVWPLDFERARVSERHIP